MRLTSTGTPAPDVDAFRLVTHWASRKMLNLLYIAGFSGAIQEQLPSIVDGQSTEAGQYPEYRWNSYLDFPFAKTRCPWFLSPSNKTLATVPFPPGMVGRFLEAPIS